MSTVPLGASPSWSRRLVLAVAALVAALALLASGGAPTASAATTVPSCVGSTGSAVLTPVPASATQLTGAREAALHAGRSIILYESLGDTVGTIPSLDDAFPPACTTRVIDGQPVSAWAFCTDRLLHVCLDQDITDTITGNPKFASTPLGPAKEKVIAYLAQNGYPLRKPSAYELYNAPRAGQATWQERTATQQLIWCVSEAPAGQKIVTVDRNATDKLASDTCANNFTDADFDAVLALVPDAPVLTVTPQETGPLPVGQTAHYDVTTNVLGEPITLTSVNAQGLSVCRGTATLAGDKLTVPGTSGFGSRTITLCATAAAPGTVSVAADVTVARPRGLSWVWNGDDACQVFATFHDTPSEPLAGSAAVTFVAATTPETPATPGTPTTPKTPVVTKAPVVAKPRLGVTKTSNRRSAKAGQRIVFRIRVRNRSKTVTLKNVKVCDRLPAGLTFRKATPKAKLTRGRYCWTVRKLAPGKSARFSLTARVLRGAPKRVTNRVTASSPGARSATAKRTVRILTKKPRPGGVTG